MFRRIKKNSTAPLKQAESENKRFDFLFWFKVHEHNDSQLIHQRKEILRQRYNNFNEISREDTNFTIALALQPIIVNFCFQINHITDFEF